MTSLVAEFLVNPVIRQARRFSLSRSSLTSNPVEPDSPLRAAHTRRQSQQDDVISETEEDSYLRYDAEDSASSRLSSRSSVQLNVQTDEGDVQEDCSQPENTSDLTNSIHSAVDPRDIGTQSETSSANHPAIGTSGPQTSPFIQNMMQNRSPLPEDDGMGVLRRRIFAIQAQELGALQKAHLVHQLLIEGYTNSQAQAHSEQPLTPSSPRSSEKRISQGHGPLESFKFWQSALGEVENADEFALTDEDLEPTFVPMNPPAGSTADAADTELHEDRLLGCEHYRRNVKMQCSTCNRWYTCRFCHDEVEDHTLIRKETRNMLCMFCGTAQKASQACVACEAPAARYYCDICKLWNDDPDKPCYHCNDCGICRIGHGIGKDFYHCKKCCACIAIATKADHKCIERATDCDCPICGDYMFTSPRPVCFMKCGHSIHRDCFEEHMKTSYKCPICNKSLANMESQFRNLDLSIQAQPMPPEFRDTRAIVLCHDCSAKSSTMYHWLGLKCGVCQSYNTAQLQIIGLAAEAIASDILGRNAQVAGLTPSAHPTAVDLVDQTGRDMRRRHSSTVMATTFAGPDLASFAPDRLARSVSPVPTPGHSLHASMVGSYFDLEDDEEDGDMIGFWARVPRSITSNDDDDDGAAESGDDMTSDEEMEDDDGDESEDDDFELLGHR
ncbi:zf-CHY-domain-containing protein [Xylariaceae sp. FL1651]|nr:zf-CHY-domain-containing protein [Xylariaceae sp. FL1651]